MINNGTIRNITAEHIFYLKVICIEGCAGAPFFGKELLSLCQEIFFHKLHKRS